MPINWKKSYERWIALAVLLKDLDATREFDNPGIDRKSPFVGLAAFGDDLRKKAYITWAFTPASALAEAQAVPVIKFIWENHPMQRNAKPLRTLIVGCGNMGASHARAFRKIDGVEIVGLVSRAKANITSPGLSHSTSPSTTT